MYGKLSEELLITTYVVTAEGPGDVGWVNAEETTAFLAVATRVTAASSPPTGLDDFRILGNPQANGGGTDIVLKTTHAEDGDADAVGDALVLEVTEADLAAQAETPLKGLSASLGHVTSGDVSVVTYIQRTRIRKANLTPASVIA